MIYKGKKLQRTKFAKWPAVTAKNLFAELPTIRGNALADRDVSLIGPAFQTGGGVLKWYMQHIDADKTYSADYVSISSS